jgi:hypothetical protein
MPEPRRARAEHAGAAPEGHDRGAGRESEAPRERHKGGHHERGGRDPGGIEVQTEDDRDRAHHQRRTQRDHQQRRGDRADLDRGGRGRRRHQRLERPLELLLADRAGHAVQQHTEHEVEHEAGGHELEIGDLRAAEGRQP